ncbi:MAG: hypothetical protein EAZ62_06285, partial [Sphingobacteriia bacterium]
MAVAPLQPGAWAKDKSAPKGNKITSDHAQGAAAAANSINHSVCRWTFSDLSLDQLCIEAKKIGITG